MKPLTIALDARLIGAQGTGDSSYWTGLIHGISRLDHDHRLLLYSNEPRPQIVPDDSRIEWIYLPGNPRIWSLVKFPLAARKAGADVIHTQYNLSPAAGGGGVTTIHDVSFWIEPTWFKPKDRMLLGKFVTGSAKRAKAVITVSQSSANDILRFLPNIKPKLRITPLATPVSLDLELSDSEVDAEIGRLGLTKPYLLTVGTRWPRKNMALAIEASELLAKSTLHELIVSGKPGWGDEQLHHRTRAVGYVSDRALSALYRRASLYLAPSRYEGFGLTLLEAFASGCPVLCSTGGAHPEVAGNAAVVEPSWEPEIWANRIESVLSDSSKLAEMRRLGLERASEFSWESTAQRTLSVYEEICE